MHPQEASCRRHGGAPMSCKAAELASGAPDAAFKSVRSLQRLSMGKDKMATGPDTFFSLF